MTREARLQSAAATRWVEHYPGKNLIQGYARWFGVDLICAIAELRLLGVKIDEAKANQIRASVEQRADARRRRKELMEQTKIANDNDANEVFATIAGYTSGGAPFGLTWEEATFLEDTANDGLV